MSLSPAELWDRLRQRARQVLPEQTYRTWLEPTEALAVEGGTLFVGAPDQFSADWNESKHADLLASFSPVALGHPLKVRFKVHEERVGRVQMDMFIQPPAAPSLAPVQQHQSRISTPLNPRYTFDQFVIGKSNDVAAAAAQAAAQAPGKVYNPLFIYGDTGLGKTHLMQGIAHELMRRTPALRLAYVGTEQFTNEFVSAIQTGQMGDFRRRFREIDLLLVDDVQFLKGKEGTQEEFFHTFNAIYEAGRQVVLTSDRPPKEIPGLESRLVSRFEWGMVANIDSPDLEHRIAILRKKASLDHLELTIPDEVIEFIAQHVKSSGASSRAPLSSCWRMPRSSTATSRSISPAKRCATSCAVPRRRIFRMCRRPPSPSPPFSRSWRASGASHQMGCARRPEPSSSRHRVRSRCISVANCWRSSWWKLVMRLAGGITPR